MRLSEEMPRCIDSIRMEDRVDQIVGHSFQLLYRVYWEGYDSEDDTYVQKDDISEDLVDVCILFSCEPPSTVLPLGTGVNQ